MRVMPEWIVWSIDSPWFRKKSHFVSSYLFDSCEKRDELLSIELFHDSVVVELDDIFEKLGFLGDQFIDTLFDCGGG